MPVLDAVFVGRIFLPEIGGGPIYPPTQPPGIWGPGSPIIGNPIPVPPGSGGMPPGYWPGSPPDRPQPQPPGIWGPGSPIIGNPIPVPPGSGGMPPGYWPGSPPPRPRPPGEGGGEGGGEVQPPILLPPGDDPRWALVYCPPPIGGWVWALVPASTKPPAESGSGESEEEEETNPSP
jgi:hypothetical protein